MRYHNFDLDAFDYEENGDEESFRVRVAHSPVGEQRLGDAKKVTLPSDLRTRLRHLEQRKLRQSELMELGSDLGSLLFPPAIRDFLRESRARIHDNGLRIRLKLDHFALSDIPWEYVYVRSHPSSSSSRLDGYLALDRRISIVRYEVQENGSDAFDPVSDRLRLVALLASPEDPDGVYEPLNVRSEWENIKKALAKVEGIHAQPYFDATISEFEEALMEPTDIFHFAGHGEFTGDFRTAMGGAGQGSLVLLDEARHPAPIEAGHLALNLSGCGVRLAVLGACKGARRDRVNAWSSVVPALTRSGIPAVVGMQYTVQDENAIIFSSRFYSALAKGLPVDTAVTLGRLAIINRSKEGERDWGVPTLYLRTDQGVLFPTPKVLKEDASSDEDDTTWADLRRRSSEQVSRFLREQKGVPERPGTFIPEIYVERAGAEEGLKNYLQSDKAGLILVGESGSGRTTLLCHWMQRLLDDGHAVLAYNGAGSLGPDFEEEIAQDLSLEGVDALRPALERINALADREGKRFVVILDAVNEFRSSGGAGPRELLMQFDALLNRVPSAAVRMVVSCSLATWNRLEHQDQLRRLSWSCFYHHMGGRVLHLGAFTDAELETALSRYEEYFGLEADLDALSPALRERLRQPLLLRMLADAGLSEHHLTRRDALTLDIYRRYYDDRVRRKRDEVFMDELAAEMLRRRRATLYLDELRENEALNREMVSTDPDASYFCLQDSGILQEIEGDLYQRDFVKFAHSPVGAFTLARHLLRYSSGSRAETVRSLVLDASGFSLAWEVAKTYLLLANDKDLLTELARSRRAELREVVAETIEANYVDAPANTTEWLKELLQSDDAEVVSTALKATYYIGPDARELYIWAAAEGPPKLRRATRDALYLTWRKGVRAQRESASETVYLIWRLQPDFAYELLEDLLSRISLQHPRQLRRILEFVIDLSVTIYINHCDDEKVIEATDRIYADLALKRLRLDLLDVRILGRGFEKLVLNAVATAFTRPILNSMHFAELGSPREFFELPRERRSCLARIAPFLDPNTNIEDARADLKNMLESDVPFFRVSASLALGIHACRNFDRTEPFLRSLFDEVQGEGPLWVLLCFCTFFETPSEWIPLLEELTARFVEQHPHIFYEEDAELVGGLTVTFLPLGIAYGKEAASTPLFERLLCDALDRGDERFLEQCLRALGPVGFYYPDMVLGLFRSVLPEFDDVDEEEGGIGEDALRRALLEPLAMMRTLHMDDVDLLLSDLGADHFYVRQVAGEASVQRMHHYITWLGFFNNAVHFCLNYPKMRKTLSMGALRSLAEARSPGEFIRSYTRAAVGMFRDAEYRLIRWTESD